MAAHFWHPFEINAVKGFYCLACDEYLICDPEEKAFIFNKAKGDEILYISADGKGAELVIEAGGLFKFHPSARLNVAQVCHLFVINGSPKELEVLRKSLISGEFILA